MLFRTRFAPSPTGYLHVGGARTALYCWLQARKVKGEYVLRIEDTDLERSTSEAVDAIIESLEWLGLSSDEAPVFQTDRFDRYHEIIDQLVQQGDAYRCYCTRDRLDKLRETQRAEGTKPRYDGLCRNRDDAPLDVPHVIRFKTPQTGTTTFNDLVKGTVSFENGELDDLIIKRTDGSPTYNLTVVVDDSDMKISHVIRGDDHINNTPRQINIFTALNISPPLFAHVPMILGEDGSRLSKRHGAVGVMEYEKQGYLPEALLNYLIRLGWSSKDKEVFSIEEMIELFDIEDVNRSPSTFNVEKLRWINQQHMLSTSPERLANLLAGYMQRRQLNSSSGPDLKKVAIAYRERAHTLVELIDQCEYLFKPTIDLDEKAARKHLRPVALEPLQAFRTLLNESTLWEASHLESLIQSVLDEFDLKLPKLALPLRVAVTGSAMSPSIGITLELVGLVATLERIDKALDYIKARASQ